MSNIAYYRVSTKDQSVEAQRKAFNTAFDKEFIDVGSGATLAATREGFSALLDYVREGDDLHVYAIDRLGRDALDVQSTIRSLLNKRIRVHVYGLGTIASGVGELITAVLAQMADMERQRIIERCNAGRAAAKSSLLSTGKTHRGKSSLGRPKLVEASVVLKWRKTTKASINATALHFGISTATVSRYCKTAIDLPN